MQKYIDKRTSIYSYDNISELYNWLQRTNRRANSGSASEKDDYDFTGTHTLREAYDLMLGGDTKLYNEFIKMRDISFDKAIASYGTTKKYKNSVVGYQVNVPNYLLGVPECMISVEKQVKKSKVLNIVLNTTYSCGVSTDRAQEVGTKYLQIVELLEKCGYRCNIYSGMICEYDGNAKIICMTRIKTDKEPLNIRKCVFPMIHPSMFRRVMFNFLEKCDIQENDDLTREGYGHPVQNQDSIRRLIKEKTKKDYIVWGYQNCNYTEMGVDKILEELKEKYGIEVR